jgi:hypothetical protein
LPIDDPERRAAIASGELLIAGPLVFGAVLILISWVADAAHLPLAAWPLFTTSVVLAVVMIHMGFTRHGMRRDTAAGAATLLLTAAFSAYALWLAWPSLFPLGNGPDIVHHLTLIHFIQRHGALPHDPVLGAYLGEMSSYTPGSHLFAATFARLLGIDGVRIVQPVVAVFVGLKAGLIVVMLLRLFRETRHTAIAIAGALLLLVAHAYLLQSFTQYGFYSQVVAEAFAIGMLWAAVLWNERPTLGAATLAGLCGAATVLCWPVLLPPPAAGVLASMTVHHSVPRTTRIWHACAALAPGGVVLAVYTAMHASSAGILSSGGSVLTPSARLFGWPLLALTAVGVGLAIRRSAAWLPVLAFAAACVAQIAALVVVQAYLHATNFYLAFKTMHLLVYAIVAFAALPLHAITARRRSRVVWLVPLLVLFWISRTDLPLRPMHSPFTEPVYRAGMWAREHVPAQCVDYFVADWLTGYWLHIDVLGNARASERMRTERFDEATAIGRWIERRGLDFAIADDVGGLPVDVRPEGRVLQRFGPAAVLQRVDGRFSCTDRTPTIDQVVER